MRNRLTFVCAVAALALGAAGTAAAGHTGLGTPGSPNCRGQSIAYLNEVARDQGIHGIGGIAVFAGLTVQEVQGVIETYCNTPPAP